MSPEEKYVASLNQHLKFVHEAGEKLGVPIVQLYYHDISKWSEPEFSQYVDWFYGNQSDPQAYDRAWLHHIHNNPHHWQYWIMPEQFNPDGESDNGCLEMPENYILEMVADWMGANMAYQGTWDMTSWLKDNFSKLKLHAKSKACLVKLLHGLGYEAVR